MLKRINIAKIDRIFKECEVVNLFGDMSVEPFNYVKQTLSYDPSKWPECIKARVSSQGVLLTHMTRFMCVKCLRVELRFFILLIYESKVESFT